MCLPPPPGRGKGRTHDRRPSCPRHSPDAGLLRPRAARRRDGEAPWRERPAHRPRPPRGSPSRASCSSAHGDGRAPLRDVPPCRHTHRAPHGWSTSSASAACFSPSIPALADAVAIAFVMPFIMLLLAGSSWARRSDPAASPPAPWASQARLMVVQPSFAAVGAPAPSPRRRRGFRAVHADHPRISAGGRSDLAPVRLGPPRERRAPAASPPLRRLRKRAPRPGDALRAGRMLSSSRLARSARSRTS